MCGCRYEPAKYTTVQLVPKKTCFQDFLEILKLMFQDIEEMFLTLLGVILNKCLSRKSLSYFIFTTFNIYRQYGTVISIFGREADVGSILCLGSYSTIFQY